MLIHLQEGHFILLCEVKKKKKKRPTEEKNQPTPQNYTGYAENFNGRTPYDF